MGTLNFIVLMKIPLYMSALESQLSKETFNSFPTTQKKQANKRIY